MGEWKTVKLAEVLRYRKGNILINNDEEYSLCRVQLHRRGVVLREKKMGSQIKTKKQQVCRAGDLVVAEMDAKFGGYGFIPNHLEGAIVSSHYYLYELDKSKITQEYFEILIKTDFIQNQIEAKGSTNYSSIRAWEFLDYEIPLQSIALQNSIAAKYLKHSRFKEDLGIELNAQLKYLSQLRQAVLQEAIEGKLTAEWRKQNPKLICGDNHASKLHEKIKAEKEQLIKEGKIKNDKPISPIANDEKPFDLPSGWVWCLLQDITRLITDGKHGDCQNKYNSGYYFLSAKDIQDGKLIYENARQITFQDFKEVHRRTNLEPGDLCMVNTGATVGKIAIASNSPLTIVTTFQKSVAVIKVIRDMISNEFIGIFLKGATEKLLKKSWGSAINNLLLGDLKAYLVSLPPFAEQQAIVERVEKLMAMIDELEKQVSERKEQSEMLMQSVLREAFAKE